MHSSGANQLGRRVFSQRFNPDRHEPLHLIVRNINRWDDVTAHQPYGLAVAMWRSEGREALYAELEVHLDGIVELPVEIELKA